MKYAPKTFFKLKEYLLVVALWMAAIFFFAFITFNAISDFYFGQHGIKAIDFLKSELWSALFVGVFIRSNLFVLQEFVYPRFLKKCGILLTTVFRSGLFLITCLIGLFIVLGLNRTPCITIDNLFALRIENMWLISFTFYCLSAYAFITLIQVFRRRMGKHYFESLLRGNYMIPVVEYRIFMFLDLYSSTTAAEEAGHYNYSLLLQECFNNLSELLPQYNAQVYQYVGDEAVLTWKVTEGFERQQCVRLFEKFSVELLEKKEWYLNKFGVVPRFKASVNEGLVTVAEIGQIKTEIAYHGDVLSTASRVRDLCNSFHTDFLITNSFYDQLSLADQQDFEVAGITLLRCKKNQVTIYMKAE